MTDLERFIIKSLVALARCTKPLKPTVADIIVECEKLLENTKESEVEKKKTNLTDRKDFEKVLAENKTDFIICQKGKGHYQIVGYHTIMTS